jgi:hypothetical protein
MNNNKETTVNKNRKLNQDYEARTADKIRPKQPDYDFEPLTKVIRQWVTTNEQT